MRHRCPLHDRNFLWRQAIEIINDLVDFAVYGDGVGLGTLRFGACAAAVLIEHIAAAPGRRVSRIQNVTAFHEGEYILGGAAGGNGVSQTDRGKNRGIHKAPEQRHDGVSIVFAAKSSAT